MSQDSKLLWRCYCTSTKAAYLSFFIFLLLLVFHPRNNCNASESGNEVDDFFDLSYHYNGDANRNIAISMQIPIEDGDPNAYEVAENHCFSHIAMRSSSEFEKKDCTVKLGASLKQVVDSITKVRVDDFNEWLSILERIGMSPNEINKMKTQITNPVIAFMEKLLTDKDLVAKSKPIRILEIGSYTGGSAMWFTHHLLSLHEDSLLVCIDAWHQSKEDDVDRKTFNSFIKGIKSFENYYKVRPIRADSLTGVALIYSYYHDNSDSLSDEMNAGDQFDIVYIDGAHVMGEVLSDSFLTFALVKPGGYIIFDDYTCNPWETAEARVREAVDSFAEAFKDKVEVVRLKPRTQVAIFKKKTEKELQLYDSDVKISHTRQSHYRFSLLADLLVTADQVSSLGSTDGSLVVLDLGYYSSGFADFIATHLTELKYDQDFAIFILADFTRELDGTSTGLMSIEVDMHFQSLYADTINKRLSDAFDLVGPRVIYNEARNAQLELVKLVSQNTVTFNIIYVDGRTAYADLLAELILSYRLLRIGGILILETMFTERMNRAYTVFYTAFRKNFQVLAGQDHFGELLVDVNAISGVTPAIRAHKSIVLMKVNNRFDSSLSKNLLFGKTISEALSDWHFS